MTGMSDREVAKLHSLRPSTVSMWRRELEDGKIQRKAEVEHKRYADALEQFLTRIVQAMEVQASLLADPAYLSNRTTGEIVHHTEFLADRAERIIARHEALATGRDYPTQLALEQANDESIPAIFVED